MGNRQAATPIGNQITPTPDPNHIYGESNLNKVRMTAKDRADVGEYKFDVTFCFLARCLQV
jgi:hypothetical protein